MEKALDISRWQDTLNADAARQAGITTILCRAVYGTGKDVRWDQFAPAVKAAGLRLGADAVWTGNTVEVLQGIKKIASIPGGLDILAIAGANNAGTCYWWNGSSYSTYNIPDWASGGHSASYNITLGGTPKYMFGVTSGNAINVCGVALTGTPAMKPTTTNKITGGACSTYKFVVIGMK